MTLLQDFFRTAPNWSAPYPGIVVDIADPEQRGRIKVRSQQVYGDPSIGDGEITDDQLPWCEPSFPAHTYTVPPLGSIAWVVFVDGDPTTPVYFGVSPSTRRTPTEFSDSYLPSGEPSTRLVKTPGGNVFEMRDDPSSTKMRMITPRGGEISIEDSGVGGSAVSITTPLGRRIVLDDENQRVEIRSQGQQFFVMDDSTGTLQLVNPTPGPSNILMSGPTVIAGNPLSIASTGGGATPMTFAGALSMVVGAALIATVGGAAAITAAGISLLTTGGLVILGSSIGTHLGLVTERFIDNHNTHTHVDSNGGPTSTPAVTVAVADVTTANVRAN